MHKRSNSLFFPCLDDGMRNTLPRGVNRLYTLMQLGFLLISASIPDFKFSFFVWGSRRKRFRSYGFSVRYRSKMRKCNGSVLDSYDCFVNHAVDDVELLRDVQYAWGRLN